MDFVPLLLRSADAIRQRRPLILNLTNFVAMDFSANALLALGASPVMAGEPSEIEEWVNLSDAVVINLGTFDERWRASVGLALKQAQKQKKPVVFDPAGAGGTSLRTELARSLLERHSIDIVRGNASEISALITGKPSTRGVDSTLSSEVVFPAITPELRRKTTFVISGETDYIIGSESIYSVRNGDPRMTSVTAMGCVSTGIIAAFRAVETDRVLAALMGMALTGICGEIASGSTAGPGSLRTAFLDLLGRRDLPFKDRLKVRVE